MKYYPYYSTQTRLAICFNKRDKSSMVRTGVEVDNPVAVKLEPITRSSDKTVI